LSLKQFAASLNLSKTTVSRALDGYPDVSPETRDRVQAAAAAAGYRPNSVARRLSRRASGMVALVIPGAPGRFYEPLFVDLAAAIGTRLAEADLDLTLLAPRPGEPELAAYERILAGARADAVVVVRTAIADERVAWLQRHNLPFVCFGRTLAPQPYAFVDGDGEAGFRLAGEHLLHLGHRRIAWIGGPQGAAAARRRRAGLVAALEAAGLGLVASLDGPSDEGTGQALAQQALAAMPDALVCATDRLAMGALSTVRAAGLVAGRDISVLGHDNLPVTAFADPPLATMEVDILEAARHLAAAVIALIGGADPTDYQTILPVTPVWRASVGPRA
jgi:LacI family transcriptional regulator